MAHPLLITAGSVLNACTSLSGWAATTGAPTVALAATPDSRYGTTPVVKMTSAVATAVAMDLTLNQVLTGRLGFLLYVEPWDVGAGSTQNTKVMTIFVSQEAGFTNYFQSAFVVRSGWNYIKFSRHTGITSNEELSWNVGGGSPSWTNAMVRIRIRIESQTGSATRVYACGITDGYYHKPQVIVDFDDQLISAYTVAFPIMQALNIKGCMNVISSKVEFSASYCSLAQLQEMYDAGWDMCNHTASHVQNTYYGGTQAYCEGEIQTCREYLIARNWTRRDCHRHFAAPFGESTYREADPYRSAIAAQKCLTARTTIERSSNGHFVVDPVLMDCLIPDGSTETLQNQYDRIDACIGSGGVLRLLFHDIVTPADTALKWTPTNFQSLMNKLYLLREGGVIDIPTLTQWYEKCAPWSVATNALF